MVQLCLLSLRQPTRKWMECVRPESGSPQSAGGQHQQRTGNNPIEDDPGRSRGGSSGHSVIPMHTIRTAYARPRELDHAQPTPRPFIGPRFVGRAQAAIRTSRSAAVSLAICLCISRRFNGIMDDYMKWMVGQSDIGLKDLSCVYVETLDSGHATDMSGT